MRPAKAIYTTIAFFLISPNAFTQGKPKRWKKPAYSPTRVFTERCVLGKKPAPKAGTDAFPGGNGHATARTEWAVDQCEIIDPKIRRMFTHYFDHEQNQVVRLPVNQLAYPSFGEDDRGKIDPKKRIYRVWVPDYNTCSLLSADLEKEAVWVTVCSETPRVRNPKARPDWKYLMEEHRNKLERQAMRRTIPLTLLD